MDKLIAIIKALVADGWWGKITIHFERGKVVHMKKEETIKL